MWQKNGTDASKKTWHEIIVNRANTQFGYGGILCAQAHGKLYFEVLKRISAPQNHLPHKGEVRYSEVVRPQGYVTNVTVASYRARVFNARH